MLDYTVDGLNGPDYQKISTGPLVLGNAALSVYASYGASVPATTVASLNVLPGDSFLQCVSTAAVNDSFAVAGQTSRQVGGSLNMRGSVSLGAVSPTCGSPGAVTAWLTTSSFIEDQTQALTPLPADQYWDTEFVGGGSPTVQPNVGLWTSGQDVTNAMVTNNSGSDSTAIVTGSNSFSGSLASSLAIDSLRIMPAAASNINLGSNTLQISCGGILVAFNCVNAGGVTGAGFLTQISNGTLTASNANYGGDLIVQQYNTGVAYPQYQSAGGALLISAVIANAPNPAVHTGDPTSGSAIISGLSSTSDLYPGMPVSGTGIPAGATIAAIDSSSSITLSLPATTGNGATAESLSFQSANGLTISGSGQTILSGANTYTGPTTVGGGTLQVGDGASSSSLGSGPVINDATLALDPGPSGLTLANSINGTGVLVKIGSGTLVLGGTSGYSGGTTVSGGVVRFASAAAVPASGQISIASGAYAGTVADANTSGFLNDVASSSTGVLGLDGATNGLDLRTPGFSDSLRVGSSTSGTLSGTFIPPGNTYRLGGGGGRLVIASNLNDAGGLETNLEMGSSGALPAGAVILEGTDTYSGSTLIDSGTLILTSSGSLPRHNPLTIDPGCSLIFDPTVTSGSMVSGQGGPATVPEPLTLVLLLAGALPAALVRRLRPKGCV